MLHRVAGDEDAFVRATGDALYDVERRVLAALLAAPRGPSTITATRLRRSGWPRSPRSSPATTDELRNRAIRHRLTRRLLDEPVVYYDRAGRGRARVPHRASARALTARITELTGLVAEVRAEGIAMVDPDDDLTDVRMPESGTDGHVTLLLAEHLAAAGPDAVRAGPDARAARGSCRGCAGEHRAYWRTRRTARPGPRWSSPRSALRPAGGAARWSSATGDAVRPLPALARYALASRRC